MPRIDFFCHFRSRRQFKIFPKKILLENDLTHLFKKKFLKNIYNCRKTTLSKALNSSFSDFPCSLSFKGALRKYFTKSHFTQYSSVVIILLVRLMEDCVFYISFWKTSCSSFSVFCVFYFESNVFNQGFKMRYYYLKRVFCNLFVFFMKTHQTNY